ncbi:PR4B [Linum perenne]
MTISSLPTSAVAIVTVLVLFSLASATRVINSDGFDRNVTIAADFGEMAIYDDPRSYTTVATFHDYKVRKNGYQLDHKMACYASNGTESKGWGTRYGWVALCRPGVQPEIICGQCLRIQKIDADYITARIVDQCSSDEGGLVLDYDTVFEPIDKSGTGKKAGHMSVEYHFVSCYQ